MLFALVTVAGCTPLATLRSPGMNADFEIGAGAVGVSPRPYVEEAWQATGQMWFTAQVNSWFELSTVGAFDKNAGAVGVAARAYYFRNRFFAGAAEVEAGYAWASFSLPMGVQPIQGVWIYTAPRIGMLGLHATPFVPLGLDIHLFAGFSLRAEAQVSWADFEYYNRRFHVAGALAFAW